MSSLNKKTKLDPQIIHILKRLHWPHFFQYVVLPLFSLALVYYFPPNVPVMIWTLVYFVLSHSAFVLGYHRYYAHRSYSDPPVWLHYIWLVLGASCGLGSCRDWTAIHLAHHRYLDSERDPLSIRRGWLFAYIGHAIFRKNKRILASLNKFHKNEELVLWQHQYYVELHLLTGFLFPMLFGWFYNCPGRMLLYCGVLRAAYIQHATFFGNSICHLWGSKDYNVDSSACDNLVANFITMGEGNMSYHCEFPCAYSSSFFDPYVVFLRLLNLTGYIKQLYAPDANSVNQILVQQGQLLLNKQRSKLHYGPSVESLPQIRGDALKQLIASSPERYIIVIHNIIHDVTSWVDEHPGGRHLLEECKGKDASIVFEQVYKHSTAARNLLAMMRIGVVADSDGSPNVGSSKTVRKVWRGRNYKTAGAA